MLRASFRIDLRQKSSCRYIILFIILFPHSQCIHARSFLMINATNICCLHNCKAGCRRGSLRTHLAAKNLVNAYLRALHAVDPSLRGVTEQLYSMAFRSVLTNKSVAKVKTHHRKSKSIDFVSSTTSI